MAGNERPLREACGRRRSTRLATWMGILGLATCWVGVGALPGLMAIHLGRKIVDAADAGRASEADRHAGRMAVMSGWVGFWVGLTMLVLGVVIPAIGAFRAGQHQPPHQLRGIHQGLVLFAQSNGGWYPGLDRDGSDIDVTVEGRFQMLLDGNYFVPEYLISPFDTRSVAVAAGTMLTPANYSFDLLSIPGSGGRRAEWRHTENPHAPVIVSQNTGTPARPTSHLNDQQWEGGIVWNDNHISFEQTHVVPTIYADHRSPADDLFLAAGDDDALLIHTGR